MNFDDWRPLRRHMAGYLRDLEAYVTEFVPWLIQSGRDPQLLIEAGQKEELALEFAARIARRMVESVAITNARSWQEAARRTVFGRRMYEALRYEMGGVIGMRVSEIQHRQEKLIAKIPDTIYRAAASWIGGEQRKGRRASAITAGLQRRIPRALSSQVRMMARTEVGRAETALSQARSEKLGLDWYEWATSEDQRVRPSHKKVSGVLVSWHDPISPEQMAGLPSAWGHYHPGTVPNCRCIALPLVDLAEVNWPHKVYSHGRIEYVGREQFARFVRRPHAA